MRRRARGVLAILIAPLAHHVQEQDRALRCIDPIVDKRIGQGRGKICLLRHLMSPVALWRPILIEAVVLSFDLNQKSRALSRATLATAMSAP